MNGKSIHISKIWRGAVIALRINGVRNVVWYHVDYVTNEFLDLTAIHNGMNYQYRKFDRYIWIRE